ncbi:hypothetical protein RCL1_007927 [Eukaryota sp. TZLM3-RCL]
MSKESLAEVDEEFLHQFKVNRQRGAPTEYRGWLPSPHLVRYIFEMGRSQSAQQAGNLTVLHSMTSAIRHSTVPPLSSLVPITLSEVVKRVNYIHSGKVLFAEICSIPWRSVGTNILVRDWNGDIIQMSVYNYVPADKDPAVLLPKGAYVAVLEPYMKNARDDREQILVLRCDHPQGIIVFDNKEEWNLAQNKPSKLDGNAEMLKTCGNTAFSRGKYSHSLWYYNKALEVVTDDSLKVTILSNSAASCLKLEMWDEAFSLASQALEIDPTLTKAAYRKVSAALMMGKYDELDSPCWGLIPKIEGDQLRSKFMISQAESRGCFDLSLLYSELYEKKSVEAYHADYVSPFIEVCEITNKGRGVRATKALPPRTLLMASRAFVLVHEHAEDRSNLLFKVNPYTNYADTDSKAKIISLALTKLSNLPPTNQQRRQFLSLTANSRRLSDTEINSETLNVDAVEQIVHSNGFSYTSSLINKSSTVPSEGTGLWIMPSFFNNSCCPNCSYLMIGEFMFVFSSGNIEAGEELCISYADLTLPFEERNNIFQSFSSGSGFTCTCHRCATKDSLSSMERDVSRAFDCLNSISKPKQLNNVVSKARREKILAKIRTGNPLICVGLFPLLFVEAMYNLLLRDFVATRRLLEECLAKLSAAKVDFTCGLVFIATSCRIQLLEVAFALSDNRLLRETLVILEELLLMRGCITREQFLNALETRLSAPCFAKCRSVVASLTRTNRFFV